MANVLTTNPIQLDTTGSTSSITTSQIITGVIVIASGDTWSCILHDQVSGQVIFRADSNIANHRSVYFAPAKAFRVNGVYFTTGTNITLVLVYTKSPGVD